jgi:hypothetical protein
MAKKFNITLSDADFQCLQEIADASARSVAEVAAQCVRVGMPPSLLKVPDKFHDELLALNRLRDRDLLKIVDGRQAAAHGGGALYKKADFLALRRTYALSLLRWRGHPIETYELF